MSLRDLLDELTRIPGVRGALVVSREDGLVVADSLMESVDGKAVAALAASLTGRMAGAPAQTCRTPSTRNPCALISATCSGTTSTKVTSSRSLRRKAPVTPPIAPAPMM